MLRSEAMLALLKNVENLMIYFKSEFIARIILNLHMSLSTYVNS